LGWTVRRFGTGRRGRVLIQPSKKNVEAFLVKCREVFYEMRAHAQFKVIWKLNPMVRGWTNHHRSEAATKTFQSMDHELFKMEWRWAKRRHPREKVLVDQRQVH
jgi:RNA-directed DNA polymerase